MALSDQQMQVLQKGLVGNLGRKPNEVVNFGTKENPLYYSVVNTTGDGHVTQAIAVAPCDPSGKNVDYSQTAIVVAGTQPDNPVSV